nr:RagB/SusD family nutrient uptake outer membrane protein [uncultured Parabacteroides sp.]
MKKRIIYLASVFLLSLTGCNNDFLEYLPKTDLTEETAFVTYDNFKTYSWGLYSIFQNKVMRQRVDASAATNTLVEGDVYANYLYESNSTNTQHNDWQWNNITSSMNTDDSWNFDFIRRVNILLHNVDKSEMNEADRNHWRSVGLFFRAFRYYDLLARYGDVPWLEDVVSDQDEAILYGKRSSRDEVAENILRDLLYAEENIKEDGEGIKTNTINRDCIRVLLSRFCLFEGTWRKYHALENSSKFLSECERVSKLLLDSYPSIANNYVDLYTTDNLSGFPGVILYKQFENDLIMSTFPRAERGGSQKFGMHARTVGRYLCQDGKPIATSALYKGKGPNATVNDEFYNRDHRLYWRCIPPYKTNKTNGNPVTEANKDSWWTEGMDEKDRYFIDYMNKINDANHQFPLYTWQPQFLSRVPMIQTSPHSW